MSMTKPLLLDLFCGAGGSAVGYARAGFSVVGVDIEPMPRYPFEFYQADAIQILDNLVGCGLVLGTLYRLADLAAIHASPPCQGYSAMSRCRPGLADEYPKLIEPVRERLRALGLPYIIENVPGAPLIEENTTWICGCQLGCTTYWTEHKTRVQLRRKRGFETSFPVGPWLPPHDHSVPCVPVAGHGAGGGLKLRGPGQAKAARGVMQIGWMTRDELTEAIPPAFTEYVGKVLMRYLAGSLDNAA